MTIIPGVIARKLVDKVLPYSDVLYTRLFYDLDKIDKSPRSEDAIITTLQKGIDVLDDLDVPYSLGRGSILGLHRDGKFLPGDIDIDIDVFNDSKVYQIIKKMPFEILLINSAEGRYMQLAFLDDETDVIFDIWFYHLKSNFYINRNYNGFFYLPEEKVNNLDTLHFKGADYPSFEPDWFCEYWYGKDWRMPKEYKGHWTLSYKKDCSGFKFMKGLNNKTLEF